jgi:hypothetical protein
MGKEGSSTVVFGTAREGRVLEIEGSYSRHVW